MASAPLSRTRVRVAIVLNQLITPGMGSLMCRRWFAGTGQLVSACFGFALIMLWFGREMHAYYGTMFSDQPVNAPPGRLALYGWLIFAISWVWSGWTCIQLSREASDVSALKIAPAIRLDDGRVTASMASVPRWKRDGQVISRTFQFKDFPAAIRFVNAVAGMAEGAWHHPDIDIRWNKVTLALTTHDAGGLTEKDFLLAKKFDELSP
jgi:4a-hydroxytetrahydrobiopterin dehydratase